MRHLLRASFFASLLMPFAGCLQAPAQSPSPSPSPKRYDASIPTPEQSLGRSLGAEVSLHAELWRALDAIDAASPKVARFSYGRSIEGRELAYVVVGSEQNLARLPAIQSAMKDLADPRGLSAEREREIVASMPAVAWLAYCVHGDEPSGSEACVRLVHHLAAAQGDPIVDAILRDCVVVLDPLQNPDGRDRFVHGTRASRGIAADEEPVSAEHTQPWPGGRVNHALFDMNRDWFAQTQPETKARVAAFFQWWPLVYADVHEMGGESTYYFAPPAKPINPAITETQRQWLQRYGINNGRRFDEKGFEYFTRDEFDSFYPGYGEGWPTFHGSVGMTYEMASARGLIYRKKDESRVTLQDGIERNFTASLATLETLAVGKQEAMAAFVAYRRSAIAEGETGSVREFVMPMRGAADRSRLRRLAKLLLDNGIEAHVAKSPIENDAARPLLAGDAAKASFEAGSLVVRTAQPNRLAGVLLLPHIAMDDAFVEEQRAREQQRKELEFYDLTGWSMPLLFGVEAFACGASSRGELEALRAETVDAAFVASCPPTAPKVAYVIAWGQNGAGALLADLLQHGVRVRSQERAFRIAGKDYAAGSLVVRVDGQPDGLHARIAALSQRHCVDVGGVDSSWVESGVDFGSNRSHVLKAPRVAMAWDRPVSPTSAGAVRHLLERRYGVPVTAIRTRDLARADLDRFTVLVLPEGSDYEAELGKRGAEAIHRFVDQGGVLVTIGAATRWLTVEGVALLATKQEDREKPKKPAQNGAEKDAPSDDAKPSSGDAAAANDNAKKKQSGDEPFDYATAILPDKEEPAPTPGAIVRVRVDAEHWLGFGYAGSANVVHESSRIYAPLKLDLGTNVAVYDDEKSLMLSGFMFDSTKKQLANKAWLVHQPHQRGHVVAFAEDPFVRCFADGMDAFVLNAVLMTAGR
jgi:hypothetical protein